MKLNFRQLLPATGRDIPIEFRLFEISLTITILILYFYTIYGMIIGYHWPIMTVYTSAAVIYTLLYVGQKKGMPFRMLTMVYYFIAFVLLALAWLPSGGMRGVITNMFVLIFVSGLLILNPKDFLVFFTVSLLMVSGYMVLENFYPDAAAPYVDERKLMLDISVSNLIMLTVLGVTIYIFKKEYLQDKQEIKVTNWKLKEEKGKAEAAGRAKSLFLANVSHEMRTPLNGIVGSSELLKSTDLNVNQRQILANLSSSNDQLNGLISDILDITMMESGRLILVEKEFELHDMVNELVRWFKTKQPATANVSLFATVESDVPQVVKGDEERIRRILIHLIKNGLKFTNEGVVSVRVSRLKGANEEKIRFEVKDTGTGVSSQNRDHIFEPFQNALTDEGKKGLGIGLNISKKLTELMGGEMDFQSNEHDRGSLFYFQIPLKVGSEHHDKHQRCLKSLKVLVAEDQEINQVITKKMLQNIGVSDIDIAVNGMEAVDKSIRKDYDVILMDLRMPEMDGIQATQEILSKTIGHSPVIIAVTANALEIDKEKCMNVGMLDFINKPFTKETLQSSIQHALTYVGAKV